jgi:hypothetical protein
MRFWRSFGLAALAVLFLTLPARAQDSTAAAKPPAPPKPAEPERRAWMMGLSYAYGGARFVGADRTVISELRSDTGVEYPQLVVGRPDWSGTDTETSGAMQFRFGYAMNKNWSVGFERSNWIKDFDAYKWNFAVSMLSATHYVGGKGLFVRGGAGITTLGEKVPASTDTTVRTRLAGTQRFSPPFFVHYENHGFAIELAAGYERRLYQRISISPEISYRSLTYGNQIRTQIGSGIIGLNWWF